MLNKEIIPLLKKDYEKVLSLKNNLATLRNGITTMLSNVFGNEFPITANGDSYCFCNTTFHIKSVFRKDGFIYVSATDEDTNESVTIPLQSVKDPENVLAFCVELCNDSQIKKIFS